MRKNLRNGLFAVVLTLCTVTMFSGCELISLFNLFGTIADYNYIYVKNNTSSDLNFTVVDDPAKLSEDETALNKSFTVVAGQTLPQAFSGNGYYKITIGDNVVLPASSMSSSYTYAYDEEYYLISAHSLLTVSKDSEGNYTYTFENRSDEE